MTKSSFIISLTLLFTGLFSSPVSAQVASWYGAEYQNRPVACGGERFNPAALTAAHPSLPCGTRVRVVNPANNRSVIVRINDRGPFTGRRSIDLSRAAFQRLAPLSRGVIRVRLQRLR